MGKKKVDSNYYYKKRMALMVIEYGWIITLCICSIGHFTISLCYEKLPLSKCWISLVYGLIFISVSRMQHKLIKDYNVHVHNSQFKKYEHTGKI